MVVRLSQEIARKTVSLKEKLGSSLSGTRRQEEEGERGMEKGEQGQAAGGVQP